MLPAWALHSRARRGAMQRKLTDGEQVNSAREDRQTRREGLTLVLLRGRFSVLPTRMTASHVK